MYMIFCAVDAIELTFFILYNTPDVFVKFLTMRFSNGFTAIFSSKYNLVENLMVAHDSYSIGYRILFYQL
ncbi:hypothetical protein NIASO_08115 [Niabella soli DSM 19437]|uniref:Uncharacterized protein n=1 Tax=Niabella soli DSM 19437 TaxID=929713 RepID=W0F7L9_9BACT|nr:hypothetical protein NIASO_08115 [Niabella soli DSM 19437]